MTNGTRGDPRRVLLERIRALSRPLAPLATGYRTRPSSLEGVAAVVFDIYGTLLISGSGDVGTTSQSDGAEALVGALAAAGIRRRESPGALPGELLSEAISREHDRLRRGGIDYPEIEIRRIWEGLWPQLGLTGSPEPEALERLAVEYECRTNPVWPMPGLARVLSSLAHRGLRLGVVSNAQFYTPLLFEALLGASPEALGFTPELCAWSYRHGQAKPSLALFETVRDRLRQDHRVEPAQTLYVGNDMLKDMMPAAAIGWRTVLFAGDRRSLRLRENDPRCSDLHPDAVIDHLEQLSPAP